MHPFLFLKFVNMTGLGNILGKIFGKGAETAISGIADVADRFIQTKEEKAEFEKAMTEVLFKAEQVDQVNVTERWRSDMSSDNKLSKTIRPLVLAFLTLAVVIIIVLDGSVESFVVKDGWIVLLQVILINVYTAYFGGRTIEKFKSMTKNK